jgi:hypothetical protein
MMIHRSLGVSYLAALMAAHREEMESNRPRDRSACVTFREVEWRSINSAREPPPRAATHTLRSRVV